MHYYDLSTKKQAQYIILTLSSPHPLQKEVEYVTEENKELFGLHDVVLPLPGYDVMLPSNKGNWKIN